MVGLALEPLQRRLGALGASLALGAAWSVWHFIPLVQVGRSPEWIAWWTLYAVASRVLYTWIYNNTGRSVFAVALFHAMAKPQLADVPKQRISLRPPDRRFDRQRDRAARRHRLGTLDAHTTQCDSDRMNTRDGGT